MAALGVIIVATLICILVYLALKKKRRKEPVVEVIKRVRFCPKTTIIEESGNSYESTSLSISTLQDQEVEKKEEKPRLVIRRLSFRSKEYG